ncbi:MAG: type IV secretion system protein [Rickettsiales bacterium]|jgi:type IV secretion system protein VirB6|nr:type IV secretion system protein [Rickettsiales bacterium]
MNKIRVLVLTLLLLLSFNQFAYSYGDDNSLDDTCTEGTGILNRIVADITSLGLFSAYSETFYIEGANGRGDERGCEKDFYASSGTSFSDGEWHKGKYCEDGDTSAECNPSYAECDPEGGVFYCYKQDYVPYGDYGCSSFEGCTNMDVCEWAQDGYGPKWFWTPPGTIRVAKFGDKLCVQFDTTLSYQSIGCKYLPQCETFELEEDCFVAPSCSDPKAQESITMLPLTGIIIQCISESLTSLFVQDEACTDGGSYTVTSFPAFQDAMRNVVRSCLMLYVILYGLKIVLGADVPNKKEMFVFGAKFVLVMYFSVGINIHINEDKKAEYSDGITTYMLPLYFNGSSELANMVYSSGGSEGLCSYDDEVYPDGYSYLSLWDSIDCRILYYFGIDQSNFAGQTDIDLSNFEPNLLGLLLPAIFSFQLVFLVFSIMFFVFFLSIVIYFVNITVISLILMNILIYLAPVFVPMVLFEVTKGYYDSWLKLVTSYALQPMIIAVYIAMMMTIYDQTMFGDCKFTKSTANVTLGGYTRSDVPIFTICDPANDSACTTSANVCEADDENCEADSNITPCEDSIGYILNPIIPDQKYTQDIDAIFFTITILKSNVVTDMLNGLVTLCLFGYLFYKFADMLSEITGELTGGPPIGAAAGSPMALVDKAGGAVKSAAKAAIGGGGKGGSGASSSDEGGKPRSGAESSAQGGGGSGASSAAEGGKKSEGDKSEDNK